MSLAWTVLGSGAPYPRPDRACSGYLLSGAGRRIWVDAGPGSLANLQRHARLQDLDAVWISHLHADHTADLVSAYYALAFGGLRPAGPIPVFAPAGLGPRLAGFFGRDTTNFLDDVFDLQPIHNGHQATVGEVTLTARGVRHDVESYALGVTFGDTSLVYSGDSGPTPALDELAAGCDLLVCEADTDSWPANEPQWHHTPEDAGALARRSDVGRLLVTHVGAGLTVAAATARAAATFGGETVAAHDNDTHEI